jgi:hypothetical protein
MPAGDREALAAFMATPSAQIASLVL